MEIDISTLTAEDALAYIALFAEQAADTAYSESVREDLQAMKASATGLLGELLGLARIASMREKLTASPAPARDPIMVIPPAEDDVTPAVEEPAPDDPPPIGQIKDGGKVKALAEAGWTKAQIADELHVDTRVVEEYAKVMRIPFKRRRTSRKMLENLAGDPALM